MKIKRVRLEDIETQAITGAITSTAFLKRIRRKLKPQHFKSVHSQEVLKWVYEFWDSYNKAPGQEVLRIFKDKKKKLGKDKAKLVSIYLEKLSADYEKQSRYNVDYLYDKLIPFIRKRDIENLRDKLSEHLENDHTGKASDALVNFQLVHRETSKIFNPFDEKYIEENFEATRTGILELPDALGELIGPLDRSWLVTFTAPEKRGKSWWLLEMAFQAISQKRNVLFVSFEMSERDIRDRLWKRLTAATSDGKRKVNVPVLDCLLNQSGECEDENREGSYSLTDNAGEISKRKIKVYQPCSYCRERNIKKYESSFWYEKVEVNKYSKKLVVDRSKNIESMLGSNLRVKCFSAYSSGSRDIRAMINELDVNEGFSVDVLIDDYLDIHAKEEGDYSERGNIDAAWKSAKGLAQDKSLLYLTVDQSSKITYDRDIRLYDTSEDKRKNAHLDVKVAMNSMPEEEYNYKEMPEDVEILRFSVIAHRHKSFKPSRRVVVLQQKAIGQPLVDCAWYKNKS
jgi:sulfur relay (sulfurtransferase) DsrC/TusE family protein